MHSELFGIDVGILEVWWRLCLFAVGVLVAETLESMVEGVVGRVLRCSLRWNRICIRWIGVVSEDQESSDPKAQEKLT